MPDTGYAWHGLLRNAFGSYAPKPFVDRTPLRSNLVLGYIDIAPEELRTEERMEPLAARALGLQDMRANSMPVQWRAEQELSFEVRVRPVVRTRSHARTGRNDEMDAAVHASLQDSTVTREQAYYAWMTRELARNGAASLLAMKTMLYRRTRVLRRNQDENRNPVVIEGPELWVSGRLSVQSGPAFDALLRRGLGRHRAFGFGCLLVGRPGVFDS